jgi:serine protease Do
MQRLVMPVIALGVLGAYPLIAQTPPPAPPAAPAPPVAMAQPTPMPPAAKPAPPAPPAAGRVLRAPGLLFAGPASQSYLGVHLVEVSQERARELGMSEPYGVEITSAANGSPAAAGGARKGDVIVQYRGQRVEGLEHLVRLVRETPVGRQVALGVRRGGADVNLNVEIGERKNPANVLINCGEEPCEIQIPNIQLRSFDFDFPKPRMVTQSRLLGAELESLEGQLAEHFGVKEGVLVRAVDANSPAARAGLKAGDVIVEVASRSVRDPGQIREAVRSSDADKTVAMAVVRNRSRVSLDLEPQARDANSFNRPGRRIASPRPERF